MDMSESKELKSIHPEKAEEPYGLLLNWFADTNANLPISKETGKPIILKKSIQ